MLSSFRLKKWYIDVVTEEGQTIVGYHASLHWGLVSSHYYGYIFLDRCGDVHITNRFRHAAQPRSIGPALTWDLPGIHGEWMRARPAFHERLFESQSGTVDWHCLCPLAQVEVDLKECGTLRGLGYVERLEITVLPWQLPIERLHWGRFLSGQESVVWICWKSPSYPKTLVFHNGNRHDEATIEENGLLWDGNRLKLSAKTPLRAGRLGNTVLANGGWIKRFLPKAMLQLQESKWRSRCVLENKNGTALEGWAIHEIVTWT